MKTINSLKGSIFFLLSVLLFFGFNSRDNYKPKTHTVEIKDMKFQPSVLKVHKGDTVIWINKDIVPHDITEDKKGWASPPLINEASWKKVITKSDSYFCSIHVVMKGKLILVE